MSSLDQVFPAWKHEEAMDPATRIASTLFAYVKAQFPQALIDGIRLVLSIVFPAKVMSDCTYEYNVDAVNGVEGEVFMIADFVNKRYQSIPL